LRWVLEETLDPRHSGDEEKASYKKVGAREGWIMWIKISLCFTKEVQCNVPLNNNIG